MFSWEAWKFRNQQAEDLLLLHIRYLEYNAFLHINNLEYKKKYGSKTE